MYKSRLGTIVIDCRTQDVDAASRFWAEVLGRRLAPLRESDDSSCRDLQGPLDEVRVLVQGVQQAGGVHLDIETTDLEAEVSRLERLGATRVGHGTRSWVMQAPTGQRFRVVSQQRPDLEERANTWPQSDAV